MESKKVTLSEVGCCAMTHAFLRHPSQVRQWGRVIGPLQILYEIFQNTLNLAFVPCEETVLVYRAFAENELRRLAGTTNAHLLCRHGATAHAKALEQLLNGLPSDVGH